LTEPVCLPHLPVRPEQLTPDWVVHLAAERAHVDRECEPVATFGPSFEQTRLEQQSSVTSPVSALVRAVTGLSPAEAFAVGNQAVRLNSPLHAVLQLDKLLLAFIAEAQVEGEELHQARVRDAKVSVFVMLAAPCLPAPFVTAALSARQAGAAEAPSILSQIDAVPGLRAQLSADVQKAVGQGKSAARAGSLTDAAGLASALARARSLSSAPPAAPTADDRGLLAFAQRFASETAFRIGVYAALYHPAPAP
jgi:hypothetical protein